MIATLLTGVAARPWDAGRTTLGGFIVLAVLLFLLALRRAHLSVGGTD